MTLNNIMAFIILSIPMILEIIQDNRDFKKEKKDKKVLDVILRVVILLPLTYLAGPVLTGQTMWQGLILATGIYVMFFDFIMGYIVKKNIFYLGNTSKLDQIWGRVPWHMQIPIRGILLASAMSAFYTLDKIVGKHYF